MNFRILIVSLIAVIAFIGCNKKDTLVMATSANFAPFEYIDGGEFKGIDIEIAQRIAKDLDKELVIKDMEFDSVVQSISSNNADIGISGLTINNTRMQVIDFSDTYFSASQMIITRDNDARFANLKTKEDVVKTINSLENLKIGAQVGTTGEFYAKGDKDWGFDGFPKAQTLSFTNGAMAVTAMLNNQIDIVIIDEMPARVLVQTNKGAKLIDISLTDEKYAIGVNKNKKDLLDNINAILKKMQEDGSMQAIINKYYAQ
ncbi:arginine-binding protein [Helicobacter sp. 16-1353]|uniref:transporter substrate-binding domain-containing protein n=1 Tax=Helicobacter sp. 16-1353 TaxID=2004996 RepID=UPI000DCB5FD0|nr:transporter substrate-binding domain-containing protein [Helicobacter sp. 16-1353]RAX54944.1 arginine-binding protein [Helicobacter sp. 16-1353]